MSRVGCRSKVIGQLAAALSSWQLTDFRLHEWERVPSEAQVHTERSQEGLKHPRQKLGALLLQHMFEGRFRLVGLAWLARRRKYM